MQNRKPVDILGLIEDFKLWPDPNFLERGRQLPSPISAVRPDFLDVRRRLQHAEMTMARVALVMDMLVRMIVGWRISNSMTMNFAPKFSITPSTSAVLCRTA